MTKRIIKVGLCLVRGDAVLLARSRGDTHFQIPGGKPEARETDIEALAREIREELSVDIEPASATHIQTFEAMAAGRPDTMLELRLYSAEVTGEPTASSEIDALHWQPLTGDLVECTDVVRNHLLPYLASQKAQL